MRKHFEKLLVTGILILVFMTGCDSINNRNEINTGSNGTAFGEADDSNYDVEEGDKQNDTKSEQSEGKENGQTNPQATATTEELEKEMAAYRAEREKGESSLGNYTLAQLPSEKDYKYGIGASDSYTSRFDARELNEAYKVADDYVNGTLKLEGEAWECIDPRMTAIYEDEDKGVAGGYDADNIFLCEYNDNGTWKYLILVREGKGSDWKVLYHGSSYKKDDNDGGDKK